MDVMEIPARVISLWPWDQLGLDGREDNLRSLLDPDRLVLGTWYLTVYLIYLTMYILGHIFDLLDHLWMEEGPTCGLRWIQTA